MPKKIRYAVAGLGWVAQSVVLPGFTSARENSELVALVSGSRDKLEHLGQMYGVTNLVLSADYERLMRSGAVDAVYLATPNDSHLEYTEIAAKYGVHVLCEKPMAVDEASCRRMIEACRTGGVHFMVAYRLHLHPAFLRAVELAGNGELGEVRLFESHFVEPIPEGDSRLAASNGAGPLDYIGIYCLNAARSLFGDEPVRGVAFSGTDGSAKFSEVPEAVSVLLQFPKGRLASFTCSFNAPYRSNLRLTGSKGDVFIDRAYAMTGAMTLTLTKDGQSTETVYPPNDQFGAELYYFSSCLQANRAPQPSALEGLADVRWLRALHDSCTSGRLVELSAVTPELRPLPSQALNFPAPRKPPLFGVTAPF